MITILPRGSYIWSWVSKWLTCKSHLCNTFCLLCRNTFHREVSDKVHTGHNPCATVCPTLWEGTGPGSAGNIRHTRPHRLAWSSRALSDPEFLRIRFFLLGDDPDNDYKFFCFLLFSCSLVWSRKNIHYSNCQVWICWICCVVLLRLTKNVVFVPFFSEFEASIYFFNNAHSCRLFFAPVKTMAQLWWINMAFCLSSVTMNDSDYIFYEKSQLYMLSADSAMFFSWNYFLYWNLVFCCFSSFFCHILQKYFVVVVVASSANTHTS